MTAPPFAYFGGKTTLADKIVKLLPKHDHYVEPFAGSLAVLLAKPRSPMETVNDLDGDLMHFWRILRDRAPELMRVCAMTPHSRAEHQQSYDRPAELDDLERARRVWVGLTQGRAGTLRRTGWRHYLDPAGSSTGMPDYLAGYVGRMAPAVERLQHVSLECRPALDVITAFGSHANVLLYVDPPYLASTRSSGTYQVEMGGADEHATLATALLDCAAAVVLSGYSSPLYEALFAGWHRLAMSASTGQGGTGTWANRTEVLWSNRPLGVQASLFGDTA